VFLNNGDKERLLLHIKKHKEEQLPSAIRILVVDDYNDWRNQVRFLLQARPEWQVICEASDGLEAVRKATELKPDLVLLDIGLPKLNGIDAARQIRQLSPSSRIIFLSLHDSPDVVQAALSTGALGYVRKTDAGRELLPAMDAVLRGKQFVRGTVRDSEFTDPQRAKDPHCHEVQFYSDEAVLLDTFARFVAVALKAGDAAIVVATESHRDGIALRLKARGLDVDAATQQGTYIPLDVVKTLSTFMVNDTLDSARFFEVAGGLIETAASALTGEHPRVVACGECAPFLWAEGNADAAIQLEQLWDEVSTTFKVDILCGYALSSFHGKEDEHVFQSICSEHSAVYSQ
jgi:DNA-binding NarL/FixJ family response regulator